MQTQLMSEKDRNISMQQDMVRLEAEHNIQKREIESLRNEIERTREAERALRIELQEALKSGAGNKEANSEIMAQLLKKTDELQVSAQVSDLNLQLREKDLLIKDLEHKYALRERELSLELDRAKDEIKLRELEIVKKQQQFEREKKSLQESGLASKRLQANLEREQRVMAGVIHRLGFEVFKDRQYTSETTPN